jgi:nucleoside-diphosphate-sugar epimerase
MSRVLVTGGAGFIGQHSVIELVNLGHHVSVLDIEERPPWLPPEVTYTRGNILDVELCEYACRSVDKILHLAAQSRSAPSVGEWEENLEVNILGTSNLLKAAKTASVKKIVFASSSTVYGDGAVPQSPSQAPEFLNFYAWSKYSAEQLCLQFDRHFDIPCIALRYFSVYGPGQPRVGEYALVMGIFSDAKQNGFRAKIYGDGLQRRDFIHVQDVAKANVAALESESRGLTLNVGSGTSTSVLDLAERFGLSFDFAPERVGDARETLADISQTIATLDWRPMVSVTEGVDAL